MIPTFLQDDLNEELKEILKDSTFKDTNGERKKINVFSQDLPVESNREDEDEDPFPYIINKLDSGDIQSEESAHEVKVLLIIGIYDEDRNRQGYKDVLHIINKIYERFAKQNVLNKRYVVKVPFRWTLQDEDTHPYYFGGIEMSFDIPAVRRENDLA